MMFQFFNSSGKRKSAPVAPPIDVLNAQPDEAVTDSVELRLERELAVILARQPKHLSRQTSLENDFDADEPLGLPITEPDEIEAVDENSEVAAASRFQPSEAEEPAGRHDAVREAGLGGTATPWIKSAKRSRRTTMFRQASSVAITLLVTGFIISTVAVILFGMPAGFSAPKVFADRTAELSTAKPAIHKVRSAARRAKPATSQAASPAETPARLKWVSY